MTDRTIPPTPTDDATPRTDTCTCGAHHWGGWTQAMLVATFPDGYRGHRDRLVHRFAGTPCDPPRSSAPETREPAATCDYCHGVGACPRCWGRAAIDELKAKIAARPSREEVERAVDAYGEASRGHSMPETRPSVKAARAALLSLLGYDR